MLKRNIAYNLIGQGVVMLLSLFATRYLYAHLGEEVLGLVYFSVTITVVFIFISDMGISPTIVREVAAHRRTDMSYVRSLTGMASLLLWGAYFVSAVIVLILAPILAQRWLQIRHIDIASASLALQIISVSLLLAIPRTLYETVISGYERVDLASRTAVYATALQHGGMIIVLLLGGGLFHVAFWYAISSLIGILLFARHAIRLGGAAALRPVYRPDAVRRSFRFASRMFANSLASIVTRQIDKWVISRYLSVGQLGYYGFAEGLAAKASVFPGAIASAAFPTFSASVASGRTHEWTTQYRKLQDFCCYLYVPISAAVAIIGVVIAHFVFNRETALMLAPPLMLLSIAMYLHGTLSVPNWLSYALDHPDILLRANLWALVLVVPAAIWMTYALGIVGAALSSIVYAVWLILYFVPRFSTRCLGIGSWAWFRSTGLYLALGVVSYGIVLSVIRVIHPALSVLDMLAAYVLGSIVFVVVGWFVLGNELKAVFVRLLRSFLTGVGNWNKKT